MSGERDADALVVGAGPAGASTALRLARAGVDVLLLEASSLPRSKPCGDCLSPGATPILRELGVLDRVDRRRPARLVGWRMRTPDGVWFEGRFGAARADGNGAKPPRRGLALPRRELDAVLVGAAVDAGARLRERVRAFDLLRGEGRVTGVRARDGNGRRRQIRARVVVGADGLRSTVARRLAGVRRGPRDRLAVVGRFRGVAPPEDRRPIGTDHGPAGEIRLSREGMLGLAPTGAGRWNATLVVPRRSAARLASGRAGYVRRKLTAYGVGRRFRDAERIGELEVTGPFEVAPRRSSAPGVLLAGDAAGYFDPLTGQGIHRALVTGRAAAAAALSILGASGPAEAESARMRYEAELERLLAPGRRVQRLVDAVASRPWMIEPAGRLLAARPGLASLLVDVTGDRLPAAALAAPRRLGRAWGSGSAWWERSG